MDVIQQGFSTAHNYPVFFTTELFDPANGELNSILRACGISNGSKFLFVLDSNVVSSHPALLKDIAASIVRNELILAGEPLILQGGEISKNDFYSVHTILEAINKYALDRHSYLVCVGGGACMDVAGFAAAIAHRGIRHIRIPTTVLSQNDSGVGVKNGINYFGKKNFIGTFTAPFAVINDQSFLHTLSDRDFRSGLAEAIKVGLVKDGSFFDFIETNAEALIGRDASVTKQLIRRCAEIHLQHISSGDPFEKGSSRPLDYGHWSAHKLEQISGFEIYHGEAVIIGMCLDAVYANIIGMLSNGELKRLIRLCKKLGFSIYVKEIESKDETGKWTLVAGLEEFREHLGGKLTIMLLERIGKGTEVHEMDPTTILKATVTLKELN